MGTLALIGLTIISILAADQLLGSMCPRGLHKSNSRLARVSASHYLVVLYCCYRLGYSE